MDDELWYQYTVCSANYSLSRKSDSFINRMFSTRIHRGRQYVPYCNRKCKKPRRHSFECNQSLFHRNRHIVVVFRLGKFCNRLVLGDHEIVAFLHICKQGI